MYAPNATTPNIIKTKYPFIRPKRKDGLQGYNSGGLQHLIFITHTEQLNKEIPEFNIL
jgi:hypothetical protein